MYQETAVEWLCTSSWVCNESHDKIKNNHIKEDYVQGQFTDLECGLHQFLEQL
jgi:hypothetical protein